MGPVEIALLSVTVVTGLAVVFVFLGRKRGKRAAESTGDGGATAVLVPVTVASDGGASCSSDGGGGGGC
jgi:hypothetical protein